jgi:hypothetical protein
VKVVVDDVLWVHDVRPHGQQIRVNHVVVRYWVRQSKGPKYILGARYSASVGGFKLKYMEIWLRPRIVVLVSTEQHVFTGQPANSAFTGSKHAKNSKYSTLSSSVLLPRCTVPQLEFSQFEALT